MGYPNKEGAFGLSSLTVSGLRSKGRRHVGGGGKVAMSWVFEV